MTDEQVATSAAIQAAIAAIPPEERTIRRLREARGWNQIDLAYHAGVSLSTISSIETGQQEPRIHMARKLAEILGVSVADIVWVRASVRRQRKKKPAE